MKVRAKFTVSKVAELGNYNGTRQEIMELDPEKPNTSRSTGVPIREITLSAVHDSGIDAENASFAKATPSGSVTFYLNNPALVDEFKPGDDYYLEFTRKEKS